MPNLHQPDSWLTFVTSYLAVATLFGLAGYYCGKWMSR